MDTSYLFPALLPPVNGSLLPLPMKAGGVPPISLALEYLFFSDMVFVLPLGAQRTARTQRRIWLPRTTCRCRCSSDWM